MEANAYTVQKLARQYWVTRLASAGDEAVGEGLHVDSTPLGSVASAILHDRGYPTRPDVAEAFAARFLNPLQRLPHGVITISTSKIDDWACREAPQVRIAPAPR